VTDIKLPIIQPSCSKCKEINPPIQQSNDTKQSGHPDSRNWKFSRRGLK